MTTANPSFLTTIKSYTTCLGQGSFGIVLKAIDQSNMTTAVKFLFPMEATKKERKILHGLSPHTNVVTVIAVDEAQFTAEELENIFPDPILSDKRQTTLKDTYIAQAKRYQTAESICIQMDLCGETLRQWLNLEHDKNDPQVQAMQIQIAENITAGLKHLHHWKIIHRNLKPENVLFCKGDYQLPVKIGDFELCRNINSEEPEASTLMTPPGMTDYMAPEAFTNEHFFQADLFSLGLVIWEVAQLIHPTQRRNLFHQLVNNENVKFVKEHPQMKSLRDLIIQLTKRKVLDRIQTADHVLNHFNLTGREYSARNGEELEICLKIVDNGGTIKLAKGDYVGVFVLQKNNISICGVEGTVLKWMGDDAACLTIVGDGCSVSNVAIGVAARESRGIKIKGSKNEIRNVWFTGGYSLDVTGDENNLQDLSILNSFNGILIEGCKNIVDGVEMENVANCGIYVDANPLSINDSGENVNHGTLVNGSNNISNVNLIKNSDGRGFTAVWFTSDYSNIQNLTCSGYSRSEKNWGLLIDSKNCSVTNSECGPVLVRGDNATLTNVDCGEVISVVSEGVKLMNCQGQKLEALGKVTLVECNFDNGSKCNIV